MWFFAHLSLGQILVIPEAPLREGFFPVSATVTLNSGVAVVSGTAASVHSFPTMKT